MDSSRPSHEPQHERGGTRQSKDGTRNPHTLRKNPRSLTDSTGRPSDSPRSHASTTNNDAGNRRHGGTQPATRPSKDADAAKLDKKPSKRLKEDHTGTPTSTSDELAEGWVDVDGQPSHAESASRKGHPSTVTEDPAQHAVRGGPNRASPPTGTQKLPPGAAPPAQVGRPPQDSEKTPAAGGVGTASAATSQRGEKATDKKADDITSVATPDGQTELNQAETKDQNTATTAVEGTKPQEEDQDDEGQSDSDTAAAGQDAPQAGRTSGVLGGLVNALGMGPATTREARLEKENLRLKEENKLLRIEYSNMHSTARKYHRDACHFHHENQRLQDTLEAMSLEVKGVTKRYEEAKSLSETRGKELLGAQVFLTKADALSMSELVQRVDGLNDEIYQAAASLGESIVLKKVEASDQPHYSSEQSSLAKTLLGSVLCKVLKNQAKKTEEGINPLLVQITLQTFLVVFCASRIRGWIPADLHLNVVLQELYEKIWSSSDQAVSGRWRALTRAQLKPDTDQWIRELLAGLDAILAIASWGISKPEDKHTLETRLPAIFKVVLDVREAIGEKFTSADMEVVYVEPNVPFNDTYMEESYGADSEGAGHVLKIVISTVGMGLRKLTLWKGSKEYEYVLSPKVVLESGLNAVFDPPTPRATRKKSARR